MRPTIPTVVDNVASFSGVSFGVVVNAHCDHLVCFDNDDSLSVLKVN